MKLAAEGAFPGILAPKPRERAKATVIAVADAQEASRWLVRRLRAVGYEVSGPVSAPPVPSEIESLLLAALGDSDLVVVAGGLGPGSAPTLRAVASALGRQLVENEEARQLVEEYYYMLTGVPHSVPEEARALYMLPEHSIVLRNSRGPSPGVLLDEGDKYVICLPGDAAEASSVVEDEADPYIRGLLGVGLSATVHLLTRTWDQGLLERAAESISEADPSVFAEVRRMFYSREGLGVTLTVFAREPEELSSKLARAVRVAEEELARRGIEFVRKGLEEL